MNALEITPDRSMIAAAGTCTLDPDPPSLLSLSRHSHSSVYPVPLGYQHIRMYDLSSNNPNPIISYDGVNKNIASVGFHEDGRWMYTGGEDCTARIWDLRCGAVGRRGLLLVVWGWGPARRPSPGGALQAEAEMGFPEWVIY